MISNDLHVLGTMLYCAKLTDEDLSRYLNKTEPVGLTQEALLPQSDRSNQYV